MIDKIKDIIILFDKENGQKHDIQDKRLSDLENIFNIDSDNVSLGMTPFQINHFVLNRKEFTTDFAQFQQAKIELLSRINILNDLYYEYKEYQIKTKLSEGKIEKIQKEETYEKIRDAKVELQKLEIEKNNLRLFNIKRQATEKLKEALVFYDTYIKYKKFDSMTEEELSMHEEESWKIKSAYYRELQERYGLTPKGFLKLPHEENREKLKEK